MSMQKKKNIKKKKNQVKLKKRFVYKVLKIMLCVPKDCKIYRHK